MHDLDSKLPIFFLIPPAEQTESYCFLEPV